MINHIVLFKVAPDVESAKFNAALESLGALRHSTIPQIQSFACGINNSPENMERGYTHGFAMKFLSAEDREYYLNHPAHIKIAQDIVNNMLVDGINSVLVFDF